MGLPTIREQFNNMFYNKNGDIDTLEVFMVIWFILSYAMGIMLIVGIEKCLIEDVTVRMPNDVLMTSLGYITLNMGIYLTYKYGARKIDAKNMILDSVTTTMSQNTTESTKVEVK